MKVKDLIAELQKLNPEAEIILSSDSEGNSFHKLDTNGIGTGKIRPRELAMYNIEEWYDDQHTDEESCLRPGERDLMLPIVCLWP